MFLNFIVGWNDENILTPKISRITVCLNGSVWRKSAPVNEFHVNMPCLSCPVHFSFFRSHLLSSSHSSMAAPLLPNRIAYRIFFLRGSCRRLLHIIICELLDLNQNKAIQCSQQRHRKMQFCVFASFSRI